MLKVAPLLLPVFGVFRGERYTFRWTSLLVWLYFGEGVVRAMTDPWPSSALAGIEALLAIALFAAIVAYLRAASSIGETQHAGPKRARRI